MKENYHILIVDDHPLITAAYTMGLAQIEAESTYRFQTVVTHRLEEAASELGQFSNAHPLDLLVVDLKLPPSPDESLLSGEDLALLAKNRFPKLKVMIATTYNNSYRIHHLVKRLNPEGFLVKNDITPKLLNRALREVIEAPPFFSKTIIKALSNYVVSDFKIDKIDRELLYHLSLNTKTKELVKILPLSRAGVERRKKYLKEIFCSHGHTDKDLIEIVKELGII